MGCRRGALEPRISQDPSRRLPCRYARIDASRTDQVEHRRAYQRETKDQTRARKEIQDSYKVIRNLGATRQDRRVICTCLAGRPYTLCSLISRVAQTGFAECRVRPILERSQNV